MDTEKLRHLITLIQTKNLRKAAEHLKMSHPGLSKSIRALEWELGIKLVTKDGRGIRITDEGLRVGTLSAAILMEEDRLLKGINKEVSSLQNRCRIGTFEVFSTYLSSRLAKALEHLEYVSFHELLPGKIEEMVAASQIDLGITYIPIPHQHVDHLKITQVEMGIFAHESIKGRFLKFSELPFVVPIAEMSVLPTKVKGLDGWPDYSLKRNVKYSVTLMETALTLCRAGLAVGYFPNFVIEEHNQVLSEEYHLKRLRSPLPTAQKQDVFLVKKRNRDEDTVLKKVSKVLRSLK